MTSSGSGAFSGAFSSGVGSVVTATSGCSARAAIISIEILETSSSTTGFVSVKRKLKNQNKATAIACRMMEVAKPIREFVLSILSSYLLFAIIFTCNNANIFNVISRQ